ncbi:MAG: hypothetical protein J5760_03495 [Clostridia bacterium]|nr:hypothetical protein [Clostridia bacterium]
MKTYKTLLLLFSPAVLLAVLLKGQFDILITYKKALSLCAQEYQGRLSVGGYAYDASSGAHTFELIDKNGLVSHLSYDPRSNTFTDSYYADYRSYAYNAARGRYLREIKSHGASPQELIIEIDLPRGIIGEEVNVSARKIVLLFAQTDLETFADEVASALDALSEESIAQLEAYSPEYSVVIRDIAFRARKSDIMRRVKARN